MAKKPDKPTGADDTAKRHRRIQSEARKSNERAKIPAKRAVQAGTRREPANPLPPVRLKKPGKESDLPLQPRFQAPEYLGSRKLEGKVAIITGADSGIGRAVAVLFAREGAHVVVMYLNEHDDAKTTRGCVESEGVRCLLISGDVRDSKFCDRAAAQTIKHFGKIDILVNNAAFQQHQSRIEDLTDAHLDETVRTNLCGYFYMARAVVPHMSNGSAIVNTGSETGLLGNKELLDYSATKGAIHALTRSLASHLLPRGIRVNAVAPGPVWTPLNPADREADEVAEFGHKSAMARPAQPEEISPAYVFLASPITASYINGIVLPVMGGPEG